MKKFLLALVLAISFGGYVIYQQSQQSPLLANLNNNSSLLVPNPEPTPPSGPPPVPTPTPTPTPTPISTPTGQYKDGQYTGADVFAYYGNVQVAAIISGGKITDVKFLDYPSDRSTSQSISAESLPQLKTEAIRIQSANVDTVSGATQTSEGFRQSLKSALDQARI